MVTNNADIERIMDVVWSNALDKILKEIPNAIARPNLGDDINLLVPQTVTASLLGSNPGFARVLYSSGYASAKRNAYYIIRRLGMPADFFWKFEYWSQERAFSTLQQVIDKIFASLMTSQKQGSLELTAVDIENRRFELSFSGCAECSGLAGAGPICFFHAGIFGGILGAMLDKDLDCYEIECAAASGTACRFKIGEIDDREIAPYVEERMSGQTFSADLSKRAEAALGDGSTRELGELVDVGYYQLLLSSSFLANIQFLGPASFDAGTETGRLLTPVLRSNFQGDSFQMISDFYRQLRYIEVQATTADGGIDVLITEAPEALGPLADTTFIPFVCGEMESLLSELGDRQVRYESSQSNGLGLILRFVPQAG